jgi:hypothetical protein
MTAHPLRSRNWFGRTDLDGFAHRSWRKSEGFSDAVFDGRPVIGIANSWSELTNCNAHLRQVAEAVKRGVWSAGGFPLEFPTISLGEVLMKPTTMLFRNLMAMDVEECIRAYPLDAVAVSLAPTAARGTRGAPCAGSNALSRWPLPRACRWESTTPRRESTRRTTLATRTRKARMTPTRRSSAAAAGLTGSTCR